MMAVVHRILLLTILAVQGLQAQTNALIAKADALDEKNDSKGALAILLEADQQKPNDAEILRRLAMQEIQLFVETKNEAEKKSLGAKALDYAQRAVKADPNNAKAHLSLSIIYGRIAFMESNRRKVELSKLIESEAQTAARLDPKEEYAWHVLGRWNYELAGFNPILKALAELIYGKFPDCSYDKAVEYFKKSIALNPQAVIHHIELGRTYLAMGKKAEATVELKKGLALPSTMKDDEETKKRGRLALKSL
ncbi:hypothetical protein BH09VER1_BH09VER1_05110 [soil metagenome]